MEERLTQHGIRQQQKLASKMQRQRQEESAMCTTVRLCRLRPMANQIRGPESDSNTLTLVSSSLGQARGVHKRVSVAGAHQSGGQDGRQERRARLRHLPEPSAEALTWLGVCPCLYLSRTKQKQDRQARHRWLRTRAL